MLRTMQKARYDPANLGHFGLAADAYTHFTSPIRRYPDLVVHRVLRESRQGSADERRVELAEDLPEIARHTSERERRANDAERELVQWKKVRFMADKVGDEFDGYVTGVSAFGLYVELVEHFVEGMVHVSTMADDYYRFVERAHILRGENNGRVFRLGDRVRCRSSRSISNGGRSISGSPRFSRRCGDRGGASIKAKGKRQKARSGRAKGKGQHRQRARRTRQRAEGKRQETSSDGRQARSVAPLRSSRGRRRRR